MCTYLKNMEGYKLNDLKLKDFDSTQEMFDKAFKRVNTFKDVRTELVEGKEKRAGEELIQENEEEVTIDAIPLAVKSPRIVDWKIHKEGKRSYYQIIRADGKSQMYMVFSHMLKSFNREDLKDLYKLVKARYGSTRPVESMNYLLWNDMKIIFEPHVEDASIQIYMLVEKNFLIHHKKAQEVKEKCLEASPGVDEALTMKKLDDFEEEFQFRGGIVGIKSLLDVVELLLFNVLLYLSLGVSTAQRLHENMLSVFYC
ncbi:hypothetical protein Tco_0788276 [Tanacetum coccineum]